MLPLLAASDGADAAWADSALAAPADSALSGGAVWALVALAVRDHRDPTPYLTLAKQGDEEAERLFPFVDALRTTADPVAAEATLGHLTPQARGIAYSVGSVVLGPTAPPAWRDGAKRLLFAVERPYFQ
jgi:hypothetical protein